MCILGSITSRSLARDYEAPRRTQETETITDLRIEIARLQSALDDMTRDRDRERRANLRKRSDR